MLVVLVLLVSAFGYSEASRDPLVRRAEFADPEWPANARAVRLVLMADSHVQGPDMPPERLARIVAQVNALKPDVVVLAGDYTTSNPLATKTYSLAAAVEPLRALRGKVIAVLGNHDRSDPEQARAALEAVGATVLQDNAIQVGPLAIGGVRRRLPPAIRELRALKGTRIILSHSPDPFSRLDDSIPLMLAGHTHCGQVVLPLLGPITTGSRYGRRYACGIIREGEKTLIVTGGLGTSRLPLRLGAPPDLWLITIGPLTASDGSH